MDTTWKRSGKDSATLSVLRPIDPVDPRMAMRFIKTESLFYALPGPGGWGECCRIEPQYRSGEEQGINPVEHAAVAGKNGARVLHPGAPLDERFHQIAKLRRDVQRDRQQDDRPHLRLLQSKQTVATLDQSHVQQKRTDLERMAEE